LFTNPDQRLAPLAEEFHVAAIENTDLLTEDSIGISALELEEILHFGKALTDKSQRSH
jgi:hypothetical protein